MYVAPELTTIVGITRQDRVQSMFCSLGCGARRLFACAATAATIPPAAGASAVVCFRCVPLGVFWAHRIVAPCTMCIEQQQHHQLVPSTDLSVVATT